MNDQPDLRTKRLHALHRQTARLEHTRQKLEHLSGRLANLRLAAALLGLVASAAAFILLRPVWLAGIIFVVGGLIFAGLVTAHRRINRWLLLYGGWQAIKRDQVARMLLDWQAIPPQDVTAPAGHPFAYDLDVPLLHRLLCTTTTQQAAQRLFDWLLTGEPHLPTIRRRQNLVQELIPRSIFRTRLTVYSQLYGGEMRRLSNGDVVLDWLRTRQQPAYFRLLTVLTLAAAVIQLVLLGLSRSGVLPTEAWTVAFMIYAALFLIQRRRAGDLFREAAGLHDMLETLGHVMIYLERAHFPVNSLLHELCQPIAIDKPSRHLRRIEWLAGGASLQGNFILWFAIHSILPLDLLVAWGLYHEKAALLKRLPDWLDRWYELDTLIALANFAYQNPAYSFPDLRVEGSPLVGREVGHPLIPVEAKVTNDVQMDRLGEVDLITGSNMSGKSTYLRTIGVNICLAQAGSVVNASRFAATPFRLFTSMRITDSIPEGLSYFYAEVKRLRALLDAVRAEAEYPVCFLIDEIFRGTNNRERLIGSRAYLKAMIGQRAVGFIGTHDLELTQLAKGQPALHNFHFEERVEGDRLIFDYRLKTGPSTSTNALLIMRAEGLPVDE